MTNTFTLPPDARVGALVPSEFTGRLRGTYRAAINIELYDDAGPFLVSIIRNDVDWTEYAVLVPVTAWEHLREALPQVGSPISLTTAPERPGQRGSVTTARTAARATSPGGSHDPLPVLEKVVHILVAAHETEIAGAVGGGHVTDGSESGARGVPGDKGFFPLLFARADTFQTSQDPFLHRAAAVLDSITNTKPSIIDLSSLVGLGIGFTPSGDDFISGALLTDIFLRDTADASGIADTPRARNIDTTTLERALNKTTSGGATLLRLALLSAPPAYQRRIIDAIAADKPRTVVAIARSHGHSSGLDALTGVIWMARYLAKI